MPAIVARSISILSDAGLGMAMFSLGIFLLQKLDLPLMGLYDIVMILLWS